MNDAHLVRPDGAFERQVFVLRARRTAAPGPGEPAPLRVELDCPGEADTRRFVGIDPVLTYLRGRLTAIAEHGGAPPSPTRAI